MFVAWYEIYTEMKLKLFSIILNIENNLQRNCWYGIYGQSHL